LSETAFATNAPGIIICVKDYGSCLISDVSLCV
jgi:hypothetical protein